jgi:hypothetical protein
MGNFMGRDTRLSVLRMFGTSILLFAIIFGVYSSSPSFEGQVGQKS